MPSDAKLNPLISPSDVDRTSRDVLLEPADSPRLANLCGLTDEHLRQVESRLGVEISNRGNQFRVTGAPERVVMADELLRDLYRQTDQEVLNPVAVHLFLQQSRVESLLTPQLNEIQEISILTKRGMVRGRGPNQQRYLSAILSHDLSFGIGPAGTGKTYLAVAAAVDALQKDRVRRIVLVRPAVEAGEHLGFLPGDMAQKVDPYLRPLYDALYDMLGFEKVDKMIERGIIEVAPLAFMRGRTLSEAFIILDEAQNTTVEQMKMFLTRIGFGSTAVVTGDVTQVDLPRHTSSGLRNVIDILEGVKGVSFSFFTSKDVVRHPLVQRIVDAYERAEKSSGAGDEAKGK